jgi:hypothetical protein
VLTARDIHVPGRATDPLMEKEAAEHGLGQRHDITFMTRDLSDADAAFRPDDGPLTGAESADGHRTARGTDRRRPRRLPASDPGGTTRLPGHGLAHRQALDRL